MLEGCIPLSDTMLEAEGNLTGQIVYGVKGADGKTPQRGVDYWTEEDREGILQEVLTQVPALGTGQLELVEAITLTEDTSSILRSAWPDGSPYRFKTLFAMIGLYQDFSNKWIKLSVTYDDFLAGALPYVAGDGILDKSTYSWHKAFTYTGNKNTAFHTGVLEHSGVVMHYAGLGGINPVYHNTSSLTASSAVFYNIRSAKISQIELLSEVPLAANTKIFLFGVRA